MCSVQHSSSGARVHFLCSLATVTPNKDVTACATLRKKVLVHRRHKPKRFGRVRTRTCPSLFGKFAVSLDLRAPVVVSPPMQPFTICVHSPASGSKEPLINCKSHLNTCSIDVKAAVSSFRNFLVRSPACWVVIATMFKLVPSSNTCPKLSCRDSDPQLFASINLVPNMWPWSVSET